MATKAEAKAQVNIVVSVKAEDAMKIHEAVDSTEAQAIAKLGCQAVRKIGTVTRAINAKDEKTGRELPVVASHEITVTWEETDPPESAVPLSGLKTGK